MAGVDPGTAAGSFPLPSAFDEAPSESAGNIAGPVGAAIEDNDDLVGKAQTAQAFRKLPLLVVNNDQGGED